MNLNCISQRNIESRLLNPGTSYFAAAAVTALTKGGNRTFPLIVIYTQRRSNALAGAFSC